MKFGKALRGATPSAEILGLPLGLYFAVLALVLTGAFTGSLPPNMVGALALLMVVGEGCNKLGNTIPIVKTYLGGSVVCIFGGALLTLSGLLPAPTMQTLDVFVNQNGFLILYIAALITGSLLSIDKDLLLRASVRLLPVAVLSLAVGGLVCGALGVLFGNGFWDNILYVAVPMTSGGMTAGTVPLSTIYAAELGVSAADVLTRMAPATVLGNCIAIILAGLLNNAGKKHPAWSGNGQLVNDNHPVKKIVEGTPTPISLCTGLVVSLAFYLLGALLHGLLPVIPTYAWMILAVIAAKCAALLPPALEDAARGWSNFVIHSWTAAALLGIGITLIDLATIIEQMTPAFLLSVLAVELVIVASAAVLGKLAGFYVIESAISAGMCTTNMGGSGNVAVLSSAHRMELLPFAQIVTRSCGALVLTLGGILVRRFG